MMIQQRSILPFPFFYDRFYSRVLLSEFCRVLLVDLTDLIDLGYMCVYNILVHSAGHAHDGIYMMRSGQSTVSRGLCFIL